MPNFSAVPVLRDRWCEAERKQVTDDSKVKSGEFAEMILMVPTPEEKHREDSVKNIIQRVSKLLLSDGWETWQLHIKRLSLSVSESDDDSVIIGFDDGREVEVNPGESRTFETRRMNVRPISGSFAFQKEMAADNSVNLQHQGTTATPLNAATKMHV